MRQTCSMNGVNKKRDGRKCPGKGTLLETFAWMTRYAPGEAECKTV
jgi:hypothetical protein